MTALVWDDPQNRARSATVISAGTVAVGMAILVARPTIASSVGWSPAVVTGLFTVILVLALVAPVRIDPTTRLGDGPAPMAVFAGGALVFLMGRLLAAGHAPAPATMVLVVLNTLAAVAEEALFRRVAFNVLLPAGPVAAVTGSAMLFGLAHVTVYGWWALPVDFAAGLVLGWQRWATNSWTVPAATHALADLLVVI